MKNAVAKLGFVIAMVVTHVARAEGGIVGFQMPSKNTACIYSSYDGKRVLRCDIGDMAVKPPRPADCEQEWGHSFEMEAKGNAARVCTGDTLIDPARPVLAYGAVWQHGGFICRSEPGGLTCSNTVQHGFSLARTEQRIF